MFSLTDLVIVVSPIVVSLTAMVSMYVSLTAMVSFNVPGNVPVEVSIQS